MDQKTIKRVSEAAIAIRAGVVLTLRDWNRMSEAKRIAWVTARRILASPELLEKVTTQAAPATSSAPQEDEFDKELRSVLERGADLITSNRAGG